MTSVCWVLLSSTLALSESFRVERDSEGLEGLLLLPIEPSAVFYGKAIGNTLFLTSLAPILTPVAIVLYVAEIPIARLEGKFKLNQDRSLADQHNVVRALTASDSEDGHALSRLMSEE